MNRKHLLILVAVFFAWTGLQAQTDYSNKQRLSQRVNALASKYPQYVKTRSMVKTLGGSDIWFITIGTGQVDTKPAVAVVGGVEGKHLLGVELAIGFAEKLLESVQIDSVKNLLNQQTFYIFPNLSPDATEQYFAKLQYERSGNANLLDYDRDGQVGEDGYDDLDGDGKITLIRVEDPLGTHILHPQDARALVIADQAKGQIGKYLLFSEGIDNDKDGVINEDGQEGVNFNKNSTYNYRNFRPGAGEYAVSELENRALFDFLYDAFNVYAVISFGPYNNLSTPEQGARAAEPTAVTGARRMGGKITSWSPQDMKANAYASELYNKYVGGKNAPRTPAGDGNFAEWAYYHYGRLSFSTPGWWVPAVADTTRGARPAQGVQIPADPVVGYLKWADSQGITNTYTPWKEIKHPDFPTKKVEVGGVHPFVMTNPPYHLVDDLVIKHKNFVLALADLAPKIDIIELHTEKIDNGLTRVSLKVFNTGLFPTLTQVGERSYFSKRVVVRVNTNGNQKVVSGRPVQSIGGLAGRAATEFSWVIQGTGKVTIDAGSISTGSKSVEVAL